MNNCGLWWNEAYRGKHMSSDTRAPRDYGSPGSGPGIRQPNVACRFDRYLPVGLFMTLVPHFIRRSEQSYECGAQLRDGFAPGSYLVFSMPVPASNVPAYRTETPADELAIP